jgi:RNA polymerase subunit RPABC4/transcription elongation factor Spt4
MFRRARKCKFCGSITSSKYSFCSACGNERIDDKNQKAEDVAKSILKMD